jgi:hypothetical protein
MLVTPLATTAHETAQRLADRHRGRCPEGRMKWELEDFLDFASMGKTG